MNRGNEENVQGTFGYISPPSTCGYLPNEIWQLHYEFVSEMTPKEYQELLNKGWRRFGSTLFRPRCPACTACRSLRVPVSTFRANRTQKRTLAQAQNVVIEIGEPSIDERRVELYLEHHLKHAQNRGWPTPDPQHAMEHIASFMVGPFPVQEWSYYLNDELFGIMYVDQLPEGLSGVYYYYRAEMNKLSPGTFMILSMIERAQKLGLPYVHLGYFVDGCKSMEYKARFVPNEILDENGNWTPFRGT